MRPLQACPIDPVSFDSERRPEEEGIETGLREPYQQHGSDSERRPEEEGIETADEGQNEHEHSDSERRPEEEGIETSRVTTSFVCESRSRSIVMVARSSKRQWRRSGARSQQERRIGNTCLRCPRAHGSPGLRIQRKCGAVESGSPRRKGELVVPAGCTAGCSRRQGVSLAKVEHAFHQVHSAKIERGTLPERNVVTRQRGAEGLSQVVCNSRSRNDLPLGTEAALVRASSNLLSVGLRARTSLRGRAYLRRAVPAPMSSPHRRVTPASRPNRSSARPRD